VSNLIATHQLEGNDRLCVEFDAGGHQLRFFKECLVEEPKLDAGIAAAA
jgi:hypothetical protein